MTKFIILALIVLGVLFASGYFIVSNQISQIAKKPAENKVAQQVIKENPSPTVIFKDTSDQALDSELTALEKDLLELNTGDTTFTTDINSL